MSEPEPIVAARHGLGRHLARLRTAAGLTQHQLAQHLAYSRTTLANVEVGRQHTGRDFWERADTYTNAAGALLERYDALQADILKHKQARAEAGRRTRFHATGTVADNGDVERREFLRVLSMAGASLAMPTVDLVATRHPSAGTLDQYAEMNAHLWRVFGLAKTKRLALPLVRDQLSTLTKHLAEPQTDANHRRLCTLTGDLFQLAGEIHFDANHYGDAAHAYTMAASATKEANNFDLFATAMVRHSFLSLYDHRPEHAEPMLHLADQLARRGDTHLATRYWVATVHAQALAGLGDIDGCERALEQAEHVDTAISPGGWLRFDANRLPEERGACYVKLHRPDLAENALTRALRSNISQRRRGAILVDLASSGAQQRDPARVADYGHQAIAIANDTRSGWVHQKLRDLQTQFEPIINDPRIKAHNDQIK
jgi:transcriptional regulator with XRE-family HTH domain